MSTRRALLGILRPNNGQQTTPCGVRMRLPREEVYHRSSFVEEMYTENVCISPHSSRVSELIMCTIDAQALPVRSFMLPCLREALHRTPGVVLHMYVRIYKCVFMTSSAPHFLPRLSRCTNKQVILHSSTPLHNSSARLSLRSSSWRTR